MTRLATICSCLVALLAVAAPPAFASQPRDALGAIACHQALNPLQRDVSVQATMRPQTGTQTLQIKFGLNLTASEHIERIYEHTRTQIFDYAVVNTGQFSPETQARYAAEGASPIVPDIERIEAMGVRCIADNFASEDTVVRHTANRLADAVLEVALEQAGHSQNP